MASDIINFNEFGKNPSPETKIYMWVTLTHAHSDSTVISYAHLLFYSAASRPKHSFAERQKKLLATC
jgi:hypothetical protein